MKKFPKWVPEEVILAYEERCEADYTDEHTQIVNDTLDRVMSSKNTEMEKAWRVIAKRSDKVRPWFFLELIATAVRSSERLSRFPPREQIETFRKLTSKVQSLCPEFDSALGHWADEVMVHYFGTRPDKAIHELADNMEQFTRMVEEDRKFLTDRTGKLGSSNAKRTFVIRSLSEGMNEWYGTPLHETVATTVSVIFDEEVNTDLVTKLVSYSKKKDELA